MSSVAWLEVDFNLLVFDWGDEGVGMVRGYAARCDTGSHGTIWVFMPHSTLFAMIHPRPSPEHADIVKYFFEQIERQSSLKVMGHIAYACYKDPFEQFWADCVRDLCRPR